MTSGHERVLRALRAEPGPFTLEPWGSGHINETFRVTPGGGRPVLLQRVNHEVFPDPALTTESARRVTTHLRGKLDRAGVADVDRRVLTLLETARGEVCVQDDGGAWWRAYRFIEGAGTHDIVRSPAMARRAAYAFGAFQRDLADLPAPRLPETIPGFHDTPVRFEAFLRAVDEDPAARAKDAGREIEIALAHEGLCRVLLDAHQAGDISERVTHNDTKINNVLFDDATDEAICVIDLDTVMPGLGPYDFGDMVRTTSCRTAEDERDLSKVEADPRLVEALARGYLDALGDLAGPVERDLLVDSGELITFEIGLRFLTDFLEGDVYFRTHRPEQNLDRCMAQFALLASLERQRESLRRRVASVVA